MCGKNCALIKKAAGTHRWMVPAAGIVFWGCKDFWY